MPAEWPVLSLQEANVRLFDCEHRTPPSAEEGCPYIAIPQIKHGRLDLTNVRRISQEHFRDWTKKTLPQPDDVILVRRCNSGDTAFVPHGLECALGQNLVLLRADGKKVAPEFLRWLVSGPAWWEQVRTFINVGAVFDSLRCADIPNFRLPIPPLNDQRAIAAVLRSLDDKIELNRRMNETLEDISRAIFKSWFVDFNPVLSAAKGRAPVLPRKLAHLFPVSLENSELGKKPKGWKVGPISDLAEIVGGSTPGTENGAFWIDGQHCWATPKDLAPLQSPVILNTDRRITDQGLAQIGSGLLPVGTVLLSSRAPIGYLAIAEVPTAVNQGFIAMKPRKNVPNIFLLLWARYAHADILSRANGSTFPEISKTNFRSIPLIYPTPDGFRAFEVTVRPLYERIVNNERESRVLAALRDMLLPKLVSGEMRIGKIS